MRRARELRGEGSTVASHVEILGPYTYRWQDGLFPLGRDSLLLGAFATLRPRWRVCDLGCGAGLLPLLLLRREGDLSLTAVDSDPAAVAQCEANFAENAVAAQVLAGDFTDPCLLPPGAFDLVISNPPWFAAGRGRDGGRARTEGTCTVDALCAAAGRILQEKGRFALVHRPERLGEVFAHLTAHRLEPKRLQLIQHDAAHPPGAVLVEAVKGAAPGLEVLPTQFCR